MRKNALGEQAAGDGKKAERWFDRSQKSIYKARRKGLLVSGVCSVIVHLHLNRYPRSRILPHTKEPVMRRGLRPGGLRAGFQSFGKAGIHIEGRGVFHLGGH